MLSRYSKLSRFKFLNDFMNYLYERFWLFRFNNKSLRPQAQSPICSPWDNLRAVAASQKESSGEMG